VKTFSSISVSNHAAYLHNARLRASEIRPRCAPERLFPETVAPMNALTLLFEIGSSLLRAATATSYVVD